MKYTITRTAFANTYRTPAKLAWRNGFLYGIINTKTGAWQAWNVVKEGNDWISPMGIL